MSQPRIPGNQTDRTLAHEDLFLGVLWGFSIWGFGFLFIKPLFCGSIGILSFAGCGIVGCVFSQFIVLVLAAFWMRLFDGMLHCDEQLLKVCIIRRRERLPDTDELLPECVVFGRKYFFPPPKMTFREQTSAVAALSLFFRKLITHLHFSTW